MLSRKLDIRSVVNFRVNMEGSFKMWEVGWGGRGGDG